MSSLHSTENKKLRREAREAKKNVKTQFVQRWIPVTNKYGMVKYSPVNMLSSMFK